MLARLARVVIRRRRLVLLLTIVGFAVSGAVGGGVADELSSGGFEDPNAESTKADRILTRKFGGGQPNFLLLVTARGGRSVDDPAVAAAGTALTKELAAEAGVPLAVSYWTLQAPPLKSKDGSQAMVLARIAGDENEIDDRAQELTPRFTRTTPELDVRTGGFAEVFNQVGDTIEGDLRTAEAIAIPITLLLLVLVFGSVIAAGLPLGIGALSVVGTFLILRLVASATEVSIFALNLTTAMGLALAIDYSLFVVSRFREELRAGRDTNAAVIRTMETAGRTVVFSAFTVAASLAALLIFPISFLRSFAYAGIAVVAVAAVSSVVALPALLAVIGPNIDKLALIKRRPKAAGEGFWHRMAMAVMRRPIPVGGAVVVLLLVLGAPALGMDFGLPDDRVLPPSAPARQVHDQLRQNFDAFEATAVSVVADGIGPAYDHLADIDAYAARLSTVSGVARVDALSGSYVDGGQVAPSNVSSGRFAAEDGTFLSVVLAVEPISTQGEAVVKELRRQPAPFEVQMTGAPAELVDAKSSLFGRLPMAAAIIAVVTFVVLFLMFGSVVVPLKALALNLLSLTATFGAMVWVFQDGHFSGALDFTATGSLASATPILMFCIAFGLSMDYEVFLLSRIKEEHDRTGDNVSSVAVGLERTGGIVTAAAALMAIVFLAFATSGVSFIKLFGIGLALAVVMDATLIRATLVPAFMKLAGEANWWAPRPLKRIYERWGFREAAPEPDTLAAVRERELEEVGS